MTATTISNFRVELDGEACRVVHGSAEAALLAVLDTGRVGDMDIPPHELDAIVLWAEDNGFNY